MCEGRRRQNFIDAVIRVVARVSARVHPSATYYRYLVLNVQSAVLISSHAAVVICAHVVVTRKSSRSWTANLGNFSR